MKEHNRKIRKAQNGVDWVVAMLVKAIYSGLWEMPDKQFYALMSNAISELKGVYYDPETVRSFMRKEQMPHYFTHEDLIFLIEKVYASYIHDERIDEKEQQLVKDRWETHKEKILEILAMIYEGKEDNLKEVSPYFSDDYKNTCFVVSFIGGDWPKDGPGGLTVQDTELLRQAIKSFIPKPIPEDERMKVVRFTKYQWPDDSSNGLTSEQAEQLRTGLEGFYPKILKKLGKT